MTTELKQRIARRIKALRERHELTQEELSDRLGFNNRQTLSAVERGAREVRPEELATAAEIFDVAVDYFTDAFRLVGEAEGRFSFRTEDVPAEVVDEFEERAGNWVATFRTLAEDDGVPRQRVSRKLELTERSSYEDAQECAEALRREWRLGDRPAVGLEDALRGELGVLILHVDAPRGISGAASYLPGQRTILVNRRESLGRRMFDIAHELFHLLTWDAMPPDRVEGTQPSVRQRDRVEQLANNFAAALLMPEETVNEMWAQRNGEGGDDIHEWLNAHASQLSVSSQALMWRLYNLDCLTQKELDAIDDDRLGANGRGDAAERRPPLLFSRVFIQRIQSAIEEGRLSLRRAVELLDMSPEKLGELCRAYDVPLSYQL